MADAQELLRQGIAAIRDQKDLAAGRKLLTEALRQDPSSDLAWLWLSRTISDPQKRLQCIDRALSINPANEMALALREKLAPEINDTPSFESIVGEEESRVPVVTSPKLKTTADQLTTDEQRHVQRHLQQADTAIKQDDKETAIAEWVQVLHIQADHNVALPSAVRYLSELEYIGDAEELVWRAIDAGSPVPSLPALALRLARRSNDYVHLEETQMRLARMSDVQEDLLVELSNELIDDYGPRRTFDFVKAAIKSHPNSQKLLMRFAYLYELAGDDQRALEVYKKVVEINHRSPEGKGADKQLLREVPVLTDKERASVLLAVREVAGIGVFFLLLAWQDAGLDLTNLGAERFIGVMLSLIGGYLLITGTSSPQQQPVARLLGGKPSPDNESHLPQIDDVTRTALSLVGGLLLVAAFWLTFSNAIDLVLDPVEPDIPTVQEILDENFE